MKISSLRTACLALFLLTSRSVASAQDNGTFAIMLIAGSKLAQDAPFVVTINPKAGVQATITVDESRVNAQELASAINAVRQVRLRGNGVFTKATQIIPKVQDPGIDDTARFKEARYNLGVLKKTEPTQLGGQAPARLLIVFVKPELPPSDRKPSGS